MSAASFYMLQLSNGEIVPRSRVDKLQELRDEIVILKEQNRNLQITVQEKNSTIAGLQETLAVKAS